MLTVLIDLRKEMDATFESYTQKLPCYIASHLGTDNVFVRVTSLFLKVLDGTDFIYVGKSKIYQLETSAAVRRLVAHSTTQAGDRVCLWPIVKRVSVRYAPFSSALILPLCYYFLPIHVSGRH